ncbi:FAD-dependent oxidoreductase [Aquimarina sp. 2201CG1-2-11]|uniref:FAD-dependent oxidoreductase n=1 Tax=Aquimarina discodermiae TaxID=3231043 RepID=UPI003461DB9B
MKNSKRREFIKLSSIVAAGAVVLPSSILAKIQESNQKNNYNIVIIGAGLAGLTTALRLEQEGVSNILILEAKDRVGGRTLNIPVSGGYVAEGGGQWIGPGQTAIYKLIKELKINSFPSYITGNIVNPTELNNVELTDYNNAILQLNNMAATIPIANPWDATNANIWDNMTLEDWMDTNMETLLGSLQLSADIAGFLSAEPSSISLLYFLFYVNSSGNIEALLNDAQKERIEGGAQSIALTLATQIKSPIKLNSPVNSINDLGNEVKVTYNNVTITTKKVVVAMMPKDVANISFLSGLSTIRQNLQKNWVANSGVKISIIYNSPFWRSAGFSGTAYGDYFTFMRDNSPMDASSGILVGFPSDLFMSQPATNREQIAKDEIESFFGKSAQSNIDYIETNWSDELTIGGCVSSLPVGVLTKYGNTIRLPEGNIHWAGTETSEIWTGYMDGAIRSGERVSQEIISFFTNEFQTSKIEIKIHPNPFIENFTIQVPKGNWELKIINMQGLLVKEKTIINQRTVNIKIDNQPNGIYSVHMFNGRKMLSAQIVKKQS